MEHDSILCEPNHVNESLMTVCSVDHVLTSFMFNHAVRLTWNKFGVAWVNTAAVVQENISQVESPISIWFLVNCWTLVLQLLLDTNRFFRKADHTRCTEKLNWCALFSDLNVRVERKLMFIWWTWIDADSKLLGKIWNSNLQLLCVRVCVCACVRGER